MLSCIVVVKEFILAILDWFGRHTELIIAIVGFASSVAIAKIATGLDLRKTLCLRRFEIYEKAIGHLSLKLNVYYNILAAFQVMNEPVLDVNAIKSKVIVLLSLFIQLGKAEEGDRDSSGIVLYSKLPSHDVRPLTREVANFVAKLQYFSYLANLPNPEDQLTRFAPEFINGIKRLEPLVEAEVKHLNAIYDQLNDEIQKDETIQKMFRKS